MSGGSRSPFPPKSGLKFTQLYADFLSIEWNSIRLGGPACEKMTKTTQNSARGWGFGVGSNIRTKVKSLKIDIEERTRNCESLMLKITY